MSESTNTTEMLAQAFTARHEKLIPEALRCAFTLSMADAVDHLNKGFDAVYWRFEERFAYYLPLSAHGHGVPQARRLVEEFCYELARSAS